MKKLYILFIINVISACLTGQTDSLPAQPADNKAVKIASCRLDLKASFLQQDPAGVGLWMDSLSRLEDHEFVGLVWDERWMLYFWTENYGSLLEEISRLDDNERARLSWKIQPPRDSIYEWVDYTLTETRFNCYAQIRNAFLSEEERGLLILVFDYLLRLNQEEEEEVAERINAFETLYPTSRYLGFLRSIKPYILKPANKAVGLSGGLLLGDWRGNIERTLNTPYAFNIDAYYWVERWNFMFDGAFGGPTLARDLNEMGDIWPKDDPTNFFTLGLKVGYDVVNSKKIRLIPTIGGGYGALQPPTPSEDEEPLPEYYEAFRYSNFHLSAALMIDVKLFTKNYRDWNTPKGSYHGLRLKFGIDRLNFGQFNHDLKGQMVYFSVNYNFFGYLPAK